MVYKRDETGRRVVENARKREERDEILIFRSISIAL